MGKVYYDMGFLSSADVIESSATDLIGQYVGQTSPKTQALLEKALGKVLLVDEAYRLGEGQFAKEAIDEVVDCITKPKFKQKLIVILAGYDGDINRLMAINPGLTSRFPESISFNSLDSNACVKLLTSLLSSRKQKLSQRLRIVNMDALEYPTFSFLEDLKRRFSTLAQILNWANARDVETLAQAIFRKAVNSIAHGCLVVGEDSVLSEADRMITERMHRQTTSNGHTPALQNGVAVDAQSSNAHSTKTTSNINSYQQPSEEEEEQQPDSPQPSVPMKVTRDPGVTDDVWNRLEQDKATEKARRKQYQKLLNEENATSKAVQDAQRKETDAAIQMKQDQNHDDEAMKRHEQERLKHELELRAYEDELKRLRKQKEEEQKRRKQEQEAQKKLRHMGVCPVGFQWIKQASGYRCAGGTHYVSNEQLGM